MIVMLFQDITITQVAIWRNVHVVMSSLLDAIVIRMQFHHQKLKARLINLRVEYERRKANENYSCVVDL